MDAVFQPRCQPSEGEPKRLAQSLKMTVLHNPFDATVFRLAGTCVSHDVVFEDLPGASVADELVFDQVRTALLCTFCFRPGTHGLAMSVLFSTRYAQPCYVRSVFDQIRTALLCPFCFRSDTHGLTMSVLPPLCSHAYGFISS